MLAPISLARTPTPLVPLRRASERLGVEVWVKRDDLTGAGLAGNKVRKLEYLLAEALEQGARAVVTTGGIQSNHCRATAVACRMLGLDPVLLLRGDQPVAPAARDDAGALDANLLLDAVLGAEVHWVDAAGYRQRDAHMARIAERLGADGRPAFVVPEGGSNATGSLGFVRAGEELADQARDAGLRFDSVVCATGSGGTLAGLAMAGLDATVWGVAVCDDRETFRHRVVSIADEATRRYGRTAPPPGDGWDVLEGFQGRGYGLTRPEELEELVRLAREEGILLDPVYTGKAWYGLVRTAREQPELLGRRVVFWHTGGLYGLFGRGPEFVSALEGDLEARGILGAPVSHGRG